MYGYLAGESSGITRAVVMKALISTIATPYQLYLLKGGTSSAFIDMLRQ